MKKRDKKKKKSAKKPTEGGWMRQFIANQNAQVKRLEREIQATEVSCQMLSSSFLIKEAEVRPKDDCHISRLDTNRNAIENCLSRLAYVRKFLTETTK